MVPFARRVRTIRMCSLDARGEGPIQATLLRNGGGGKDNREERRQPVGLLCSRNARPQKALVGRAQWEPKQAAFAKKRITKQACADHSDGER